MINIFNHSLMITGFVFVMMLVIEYVNVLSNGEWQQRLAQHKWGQYILAALTRRRSRLFRCIYSGGDVFT